MSHRFASYRGFARLLAVLLLSTAAGGCGLLHQGYIAWQGGPKVPAKCDQLAGQRVAVVCTVNNASYANQDTSERIARSVSVLLRQNVEDTTVVRQETVIDWQDNHEWSDFGAVNYVEIGRGVKADYVVGIEVNDFRIHQGTTMFKGRASVKTSAVDVKQAAPVFDREMEIVFPPNHALPVTEVDEQKFIKHFAQEIAIQVARNYHAYGLKEDFARDAAANAAVSQ